MIGVIAAGAARLPMGGIQGVFEDVAAPVLGDAVPATPLNKMCGSGMKAARDQFDRILLIRAAVPGSVMARSSTKYSWKGS